VGEGGSFEQFLGGSAPVEVARALEPVVAEMRLQVLESHVVRLADQEVTIGERNGRGVLWAYLGGRGQTVFDFTSGRGRRGPLAFLDGYRGYLQVDGYSDLDRLFQGGGVVEVGCWAGVRWRFEQSTDPAAFEVLQQIDRLYAIEHAASTPGERRRRRQGESTEVARNLRRRLSELEPDHPHRSPLGKAIRFTLNHWTALTRCLDDGALGPDKTSAERALSRALATDSKHFADSDSAARDAAVLWSAIVSCKHLGLDPAGYLQDVLERIAAGPESAGRLTPRMVAAERGGAEA
jgi:hypothetical protein